MKFSTRFSLLAIAIAFLSILNLQAQTGPGGVGNSSTNIAWLDATQLNLSNNAPVGNWPDRSGNNNAVTQGNGASQPTFKASSTLNGFPAVQFDGTNDFLEFSNHFTGDEQSVYIVNQRKGSYTWRFLYTSGSFNLMSLYSGNSWGYYHGSGFQSGGVINAGEIRIHNMRVSHTSNFLELGSNGAYVTRSYPGKYSRAFTTLGSNRWGGGGSFQHHQGNVSEVIVYNTLVNEAQKIILNNYLAAKYGLSLASTSKKYSFSATHPYEVAGIGKRGGESHLDSKGTGNVRITSPSLDNGEFVHWGHDSASYAVSSEVPTSFGGGRWTREWRIDERGTAGSYDVRIYIGSNPIGTDNSRYFLMYDQNNGDFSDGGTTVLGPGTYDGVTNSVLFTNVSIPDNAWFTLGNDSYSIFSVQTGNWNDASTWNCNCIPSSSDIVKVSSSHTVTVGASATAGNLTIDTSGTLAFSGANTLNINGNFTVYGGISEGNGVIEFSGSSLQKLTNASGTRINFYDLVINNSGSVVQLTQGGMGIRNDLTVSNGQLQNTTLNGIVLISNSSSTARIAPTSVGTPFSGKFNIQRYIASRPSNWGDWSSPVQNTTVNDWDQEVYMSGISGNDGNAKYGNGDIYYSVFAYDAANQVFDTVKSTSRALNPAEGFELWIADNSSSWNAKAINTQGTPNSGNISADPYLPSGGGQWGVIGNPYASWIDWNNVTKSNLPNEVWIYEASAGNYVAHNGSNIPLPAGQGFWVQSTGSSPSATFTESSKIANHTSTFYKKDNTGLGNEMIVKLFEKGSGMWQQTHIRFNESSVLGFDMKDATQLISPNKEAPSLTTKGETKENLMVNSFNPEKVEGKVIIPLIIDVKKDDGYELSFQQIENALTHYKNVYFVDRVKNIRYNLKEVGTVFLNLSKGLYKDDYVLEFGDGAALANANTQEVISDNNKTYVFQSNDGVFVNLDLKDNEKANISVFNSIGQEVCSRKTVSNSGKIKLDLEGSTGVYIVTISSNQGLSVREKIMRH